MVDTALTDEILEIKRLHNEFPELARANRIFLSRTTYPLSPQLDSLQELLTRCGFEIVNRLHLRKLSYSEREWDFLDDILGRCDYFIALADSFGGMRRTRRSQMDRAFVLSHSPEETVEFPDATICQWEFAKAWLLWMHHGRPALMAFVPSEIKPKGAAQDPKYVFRPTRKDPTLAPAANRSGGALPEAPDKNFLDYFRDTKDDQAKFIEALRSLLTTQAGEWGHDLSLSVLRSLKREMRRRCDFVHMRLSPEFRAEWNRVHAELALPPLERRIKVLVAADSEDQLRACHEIKRFLPAEHYEAVTYWIPTDLWQALRHDAAAVRSFARKFEHLFHEIQRIENCHNDPVRHLRLASSRADQVQKTPGEKGILNSLRSKVAKWWRKLKPDLFAESDRKDGEDAKFEIGTLINLPESLSRIYTETDTSKGELPLEDDLLDVISRLTEILGRVRTSYEHCLEEKVRKAFESSDEKNGTSNGGRGKNAKLSVNLDKARVEVSKALPGWVSNKVPPSNLSTSEIVADVIRISRTLALAQVTEDKDRPAIDLLRKDLGAAIAAAIACGKGSEYPAELEKLESAFKDAGQTASFNFFLCDLHAIQIRAKADSAVAESEASDSVPAPSAADKEDAATQEVSQDEDLLPHHRFVKEAAEGCLKAAFQKHFTMQNGSRQDSTSRANSAGSPDDRKANDFVGDRLNELSSIRQASNASFERLARHEIAKGSEAMDQQIWLVSSCFLGPPPGLNPISSELAACARRRFASSSHEECFLKICRAAIGTGRSWPNLRGRRRPRFLAVIDAMLPPVRESANVALRSEETIQQRSEPTEGDVSGKGCSDRFDRQKVNLIDEIEKAAEQGLGVTSTASRNAMPDEALRLLLLARRRELEAVRKGSVAPRTWLAWALIGSAAFVTGLIRLVMEPFLNIASDQGGDGPPWLDFINENLGGTLIVFGLAVWIFGSLFGRTRE